MTDDADELRERVRLLELRLASPPPPAVPEGFSSAPLVVLAGAARSRSHDWAFLRELRLAALMYLDPRYRLSRIGQFGIPGAMLAAILNYLVFNYLIVTIPFLTPVAERLNLLAIGAVLFLLVAREVARYRAVLEYLATHRAGGMLP